MPDLADAERVLELLDPTTDRFTFFTVDDALVVVDGKEMKRNNGRLLATFNGTLAEHAKELTRRNRLGAEVFVTVNETDLAGRATENMRRVRACWREDDDGMRAKEPLPFSRRSGRILAPERRTNTYSWPACPPINTATFRKEWLRSGGAAPTRRT